MSVLNSNLFINWLRKEVSPALGCTEPVAIAFAAAYAKKHLSEPCEKVTGFISANLYKNAMGVTIPGTACSGISMAAAIGLFGGDSSKGLETLKGITENRIVQATNFVKNGSVNIIAQDTPDFIHIDITAYGKESHCRVVIKGSHTNVVELYVNDKPVLISDKENNNEQENELALFSIEDAFNFINKADFSEIAFILEAGSLNQALSEEGRRKKYGLNINGVMSANRELIGDGLMSQVVIETVAASDARMGGAAVPAMSNFGSGNQGITATMPVMVVARHLQSSEDDLARALALSHLTAISIHARYTRLSALCAASTAAMGAAAGMVWLFAKDINTVYTAIINMISDVSGIICDGASNSCAMKVSTVTMSAFKAVMMAIKNIRVSDSDGIVSSDPEETINNLCQLVIKPMPNMDKEIIKIMSNKMSNSK
ncbi:TPA: serine dehydratase subunit alpha family protein [Yersinia enterocolitica]|nr:serine dehydratase subunit alpha family protein [Yersinia enterocolitica]